MQGSELPIGVFDSGLGGISVLAEAVHRLPHESFIYYGDSAHAPYGTKDVTAIKQLSLDAADFLVAKGIKALVVACNTATSVAINELREKLSIPVIGMEPALKPAVEMGGEGKIVVMATPITLRENKFQRLLGKFQDMGDILPLPCPGLVELIERGHYEGKEIKDYLITLFSLLDKTKVSTVVLGCTHYIFIKNEVRDYFCNQVTIIDGNCGTVKQLHRILTEKELLSESIGNGQVIFFSSAQNESFVPLAKKMLRRALKDINYLW